jgi:hypothetical protein
MTMQDLNTANLDPQNRQALEVLGGLIDKSVKDVAGQNETLQVMVLALTAILVVTPSTAKLPMEELAAALRALLRKREDANESMAKAATFLGVVMNLAQKLPEALANAKAEMAAEAAAEKAKPATKPN